MPWITLNASTPNSLMYTLKCSHDAFILLAIIVVTSSFLSAVLIRLAVPTSVRLTYYSVTSSVWTVVTDKTNFGTLCLPSHTNQLSSDGRIMPTTLLSRRIPFLFLCVALSSLGRSRKFVRKFENRKKRMVERGNNFPTTIRVASAQFTICLSHDTLDSLFFSIIRMLSSSSSAGEEKLTQLVVSC